MGRITGYRVLARPTYVRRALAERFNFRKAVLIDVVHRFEPASAAPLSNP